MQDNLESKIKTYNEKSFQHAQNWKKIHALVNYSKAIDDFQEWEALEFIIRYFAKDYLDQAQESFLDYVLMKYGIEYDKWCYRTHWVQKQTKKSHDQYSQIEIPFPDLDKAHIEARSKMPLFSKIEHFKIYNNEAM
jgi:hypothetical protein